MISGFYTKMLSDARKDILSVTKTLNVMLESVQRLYEDETGVKLSFPEVMLRTISLYAQKSKESPWREEESIVSVAFGL